MINIHNLSCTTRRDKEVPFHQVSQILNLTEYHSRCGLLVAQPKQYIATHFILWIGALLYYAVTVCTIFRHQYLSLYPLFGISVVLNVILQVLLSMLGCIDPGIIPKILPSYESTELTQIPISKEVIKIALINKMFSMGIKTHNLKIKYCNTCNIYRPPRTSHCSICNVCV